MPIIKSAIKRVKQTKVRQERNYKTRATLKKSIRAVIDNVKENKAPEAKKSLQSAYKIIDTAVKKHIIHKNNGNRKKSRMSKLVSGLEQKAKA